MSMTAGGRTPRCDCNPGSWASFCGRDHSSAAMGAFDWACKAGTVRGCAYQQRRPPSICVAGVLVGRGRMYRRGEVVKGLQVGFFGQSAGRRDVDVGCGLPR